jgi:hypothetical protein
LVVSVNSESYVTFDPFAAQVENSYKVPDTTFTTAYSPAQELAAILDQVVVGVIVLEGY